MPDTISAARSSRTFCMPYDVSAMTTTSTGLVVASMAASSGRMLSAT